MGARAIPFTATGDPFGTSPADDGSGEAIAASDQIQTQSGFETDDELVGFAFKGFTSVEIHDGTDATGTLVAFASGPGTFSWNESIRFSKGVWIVVAGTGSGSIWIG